MYHLAEFSRVLSRSREIFIETFIVKVSMKLSMKISRHVKIRQDDTSKIFDVSESCNDLMKVSMKISRLFLTPHVKIRQENH